MNGLGRARRVLIRTLRTTTGRLPRYLAHPVLTVIVDAQRDASYLRPCLSSVLAAGFRKLEVIIVAGSPELGRELAGSSVLRDRRVRVLAGSGGVFAPGINRAVEAATGRYLAFVDADDLVSENAYGTLLAALEKSRADFAVGGQYLSAAGTFEEVAWSAPRNVGRRARTRADEAPQALVDAGHGNKIFSTRFWRGAGLQFGGEGLESVTLVMTAAYLRAGSFDVVPVRAYDERRRDSTRPIAEQRRYRSSVLDRNLEVLLASGRMVREEAGDETFAVWIASALGLMFPPLYRDAVVADEEYFEIVSWHCRALLTAAPDEALECVPVAALIGAWLAAHASSADSAAMATYVADNPHGLPLRPGGDDGDHVLLPDTIIAAVPERLLRVLPVDLVPRSRLTRLRLKGSSLEIAGAAFFEYGSNTGAPQVELVDHESGVRRSLSTRARPDTSINHWAARAWEDHAGAGFEATLGLDSLLDAAPSRWVVEVSTSEGPTETVVPFQTRDPRVLREDIRYATADAEVLVQWDKTAGLELVRRRARQHRRALDEREPEGPLVESASMVPEGLRLSGRSVTDGATRWRIVGPDTNEEVTQSTSEAGRFTGIVSLRHTMWGREDVFLPAGRYRIDVSDSNGSDVPLRWTDEAATGVDTDLLNARLRVEIHSRGRDFDLVIHPPVPTNARGAYAQNQLRTATYSSAQRRPLTDTVVFESFHGRSAGDNPGAICAELLRRKLGLNIAWVVDDPSLTIPSGTRPVARRSPEWYELMATARTFVNNAGAPYFFQKRADQVHLQTWHGIPLKRIGEDRPPDGFEMWRHNRYIARQASNWDLCVSPSRFCSDVFRSAFRYDGTMLEVGYPRNDLLLAEDASSKREEIRRTLGVGVDQRVVLYAPTWRDYGGVKDAKPLFLDPELVAKAHPDTVVLVRGHYTSNETDVYPDGSGVIDVTSYPDIGELFLAADVLVTDYSSVMFDFALTDKPMILLVPDLEQYRDVERGFYFDIEADAPGPMVRSSREVVAALEEADRFADAREHFRQRFCPLDDGLASRRVVDELLERW